jgi:hypothetical protein
MIAAGILRTSRACLLLAGCAVAAVATWLLAGEPLLAVVRPLAADGPAALSALPFPVVLSGCCAAALLGCTGWLLGTASLLALCRVAALGLPGSPMPAACARFAEAACPRIARGAVVGVLGLGLGAAVTGPALADASGTATGTGALDGLAVPDRATGSLSTTATRQVVRVRPGDSLWAIASRLLPAGADDARVTAAWHRLHLANLARIGDDPDLIQPGTRLVVPDLRTPDDAAPHREEHP